MLLPKKMLCATETLLDIALHAQSTSMTCAELTSRQKIAKRHLERILQNLVRADILTGQRGPNGGYHLARERRNISLGDIARALDEAETKKKASPISELGKKVIQPLSEQLTQQMIEPLDKITLEDLVRQSKKNNIIKTNPQPATDYTI